MTEKKAGLAVERIDHVAHYIKEGMLMQTDGKREVRYFVCYAKKDLNLRKDLLARLAPFLDTAARYRFKGWSDDQIELGSTWHEEIQRAIKACDFGLLLVSPHFLASEYISKNELPSFVADEPFRPTDVQLAAPVVISQVPLDGDTDLKGLERRQLFLYTRDRAYEDCRDARERNAFARALFRKIVAMLDNHPPGQMKNLPPPVAEDVGREQARNPQHDTTDLPPLSDDGWGDSGARRLDNEKRLQILKEEIAKALTTSKAAMSVLEAAMGQPTPTPSGESTRDDRRGAELVEILMAQPFETGLSWLLNAHDFLRGARNTDGIAAVVAASQWLIPWLYVSGTPIEVEWWGDKPLGPILSLPAGLSTFAEIVMAGLDRRKIAFKNGVDKKNSWWNSYFGVEFRQPESGMPDKFEQDLREDLWRRCAPPPELANENPDVRDMAIAAQLEYFDTEERVKVYLICIDVPVLEEEQREYCERIERIKMRYPSLAIVRLDKSLAVAHQRIFNRIRRLLLQQESRV